MGSGMYGGFGGNTAGASTTVALSMKTYSLTEKPKAPKYKYSIPRSGSKRKHIFGNRKGHLPDTPENRELIRNVANRRSNYRGQDKYHNHWYAKTMPDGSQIWVETHAGKISNAGRNATPRRWDSETGYVQNPKKNNTWRKKK